MNYFEAESKSFDRAVKERAAVLIRDGVAAPLDAIDIAVRQIMAERKAAARIRSDAKIRSILGGDKPVSE